MFAYCINIRNRTDGGWREELVIQYTWLLLQRTWVRISSPTGYSELTVPPAPKDPMPSFGFCRYQEHTWCEHAYRQNTHKINTFIRRKKRDSNCTNLIYLTIFFLGFVLIFGFSPFEIEYPWKLSYVYFMCIPFCGTLILIWGTITLNRRFFYFSGRKFQLKDVASQDSCMQTTKTS